MIDCLKLASDTSIHLFNEYGIIPFKVTSSSDDAILLAYKNSTNNNVLRIEIDNENDICAVVSNGDSIICSGFLNCNKQDEDIIKQFTG